MWKFATFHIFHSFLRFLQIFLIFTFSKFSSIFSPNTEKNVLPRFRLFHIESVLTLVGVFLARLRSEPRTPGSAWPIHPIARQGSPFNLVPDCIPRFSQDGELSKAWVTSTITGNIFFREYRFASVRSGPAADFLFEKWRSEKKFVWLFRSNFFLVRLFDGFGGFSLGLVGGSTGPRSSLLAAAVKKSHLGQVLPSMLEPF